jgi:hypothetical protein
VAPPTHKRRKSSCSSDIVERRPKKGDEDYIKRPENAFILFRRKCCEDRQAEEEAAKAEGAKKPRQADLSKTISQMWKSLPSEERLKWEQLAKDKKREHEQMYPHYVYRPQRSKDKDGKTKVNKKALPFKKLDESDSLSFVVPVSRPHGRSASAPTPPPYQSIQIPNIYNLTPSCPTSPSLLPMISRRSAHPDIMANFDYLPSNTNTFVPPAFPMSGQFQVSSSCFTSCPISKRFFFSQSSDFLGNIFNTGVNAAEHRNSEPTLQHLTIGSPDALLLPANQIISPASSFDSGSSGPSSPSSGPYTPTTAVLPSTDFTQFTSSSGDAALDAQAQAEIDLQLQMQMQQEFANFTWDSTSVWSSEPSILLEDDFDINSIPPIELGVPKYIDNIHVANPGLEYRQDFSRYCDDKHNVDAGLLGFEELMAGHNY